MHNAFYYGPLKLADATSEPCALLNDGWFARNALTFSKIAATTKPGNRVIVLDGSDHAYWLRHFTESTPGFSRVEPADYLEDQTIWIRSHRFPKSSRNTATVPYSSRRGASMKVTPRPANAA